MEKKRLLAIDIDGTLTSDHDDIDPQVVQALASKVEEGWIVVLITGRTFCRTKALLKKLSFPYFIAPQNGTSCIQMPGEEKLYSHFLKREEIIQLDPILALVPTDMLLYAGRQDEDICYYREGAFEPALFDYVKKRAASFNEELVPVQSLQDVAEPISCIKCFGEREALLQVQEVIERENLFFDFPIIRDPFDQRFCVGLGTRKGVNKGFVLKWFKEKMDSSTMIVAAGDDYNDLPMFKEADFRLAMQDAPLALKEEADLICPPAKLLGIVDGLQAITTLRT